LKYDQHEGLLLSNVSEEASRRSMFDLTGNHTEYEQMKKFHNLSRIFAEQVWDTMLKPLIAKEEFRRRFDADDVTREAWRSLAEEPLGRVIERYFQNDLVRGLVLTDAKIGLLTDAHDPSLVQNRCFLYHVIGNKTGEWKVPVGGMGAVVRELELAARKSGAEMIANVDLHALDLDGNRNIKTVEFEIKESGSRKLAPPPVEQQTVEARYVLVNFGRNVLAKFVGKLYQPEATDEGSVFKINMLLRRLPKLKATRYGSAEAFCGTFHSDEGYEQMNVSYDQACEGRLPDKIPCEVYCHTLTDDSILSPELRAQGFHTMTLFGLDTPWSLFARDNKMMRKLAEEKFIESMNQWLAEPLEDCLAVARDGTLCIESKSPLDIEDALGMYHGNIFQNAPTFPFAEKRGLVGRWGVETDYENVFLCGSSAHRGGAVSGIPGHNAAMKVLETAQAAR
jgi:phytoene dehydrogenase-like protein